MRRAISVAGLVVAISLMTEGLLAGSLYSVFGLGQRVTFSNAQFVAMGNGGIALPEPLSVNALNPGAAVPFTLTRVSGTFLHEGISLRTPLATGWHNYTAPVSFDFHVPLGAGWGLATGFHPITFRDYRLRNSGSFVTHAFQAETEVGYEQIREGKGGLSSLAFDLCHVFGDKASVGLGGRFIFGKLEDLWRVNFGRADFRSTEDQYSLHLRGAAFVAGIVARPAPSWNLGFFYQAPTELRVERRGESRYVYSDTLWSSTSRLPAFWGIGQAWEIGERWILIADYMQQDWRGWQWGGEDVAEARRWSHLSLGVQFTPRAGQFASFWQKIQVRGGVYRRSLAFSPIADKSVLEHALSLGFGFPLPEGRGRLDLAIVYGRRGNQNEFPVEERFSRIVITFVGTEKWFVRPN